MKVTFTDRVVLKRRGGGADWNSERYVVARTSDGARALWWWRAGQTWACRMTGYVPFAATLNLVTIRGRSESLQELHKGGRLSNKLLARYAGQIDAFFGGDVAMRLDYRKTAIVEP